MLVVVVCDPLASLNSAPTSTWDEFVAGPQTMQLFTPATLVQSDAVVPRLHFYGDGEG